MNQYELLEYPVYVRGIARDEIMKKSSFKHKRLKYLYKTHRYPTALIKVRITFYKDNWVGRKRHIAVL